MPPLCPDLGTSPLSWWPHLAYSPLLHLDSAETGQCHLLVSKAKLKPMSPALLLTEFVYLVLKSKQLEVFNSLGIENLSLILLFRKH